MKSLKEILRENKPLLNLKRRSRGHYSNKVGGLEVTVSNPSADMGGKSQWQLTITDDDKSDEDWTVVDEWFSTRKQAYDFAVDWLMSNESIQEAATLLESTKTFKFTGWQIEVMETDISLTPVMKLSKDQAKKIGNLMTDSLEHVFHASRRRSLENKADALLDFADS